MNANRMRAELLALRTRVDALLEEVDRDEPANDSPWMKVPAYAQHARVSTKTVHRWIAEADPGEGREHPWASNRGLGTRNVRVHSEKADAWRAKR